MTENGAGARPAAPHVDFIRRETVIASPPLVPEVSLHLATEITPIWHASEAALERQGIDPPYWAFAWPGGQALARHLLDHPELVAGRRLLDFAAGSGLVAIAAAKAGAIAEANDIDPVAAEAIALNAALNSTNVAIAPGDLTGTACRWDVVMAGDVCYEKPMAERVFPWLVACAKAGALVLMADPGRAYLPARGLERIAAYSVPTSLELEDRTLRETIIWRILPPATEDRHDG
ncbi:MAG: 50S ribosomal protein L11 methyltransferase [Rhodospirillaceae bacterium]|nr:50S ribosomal protein L11 methyltransferase [Rhodospirillaceae bacterium]